MTQRAFAELVGVEQTTWHRWERGERRPAADTLADVLKKLDIADDRQAEITALLDGTDARRWLAVTLPEQGAQQAAYVDFASSAKNLKVVSPLLVPGFCQTSEYTREILSAAGVPSAELNTRVAVRAGLRDIITRHDPANLLVILGEAALRQVIGDPRLMSRQLRYMGDLGRLENVVLRVVPFTSGWHPGLEGPFTLIESDEQSVVHIENRRSGLFLHEEEDIGLYRDAISYMIEPGKEVAMSPGASTELIAEIANEMEAL